MRKLARRAGLLLADGFCMVVGYILALLLRFEFIVTNNQFIGYLDVFISAAGWLLLIKLCICWAGGLYRNLWRYAGLEESAVAVLTIAVANGLSILYLQLSQRFLPRGVCGIVFLTDILLLVGLRMAYRLILEKLCTGRFDASSREKIAGQPVKDAKAGGGDEVVRVMLIGTSDAAAAVIKEIRLHPEKRKKVVAVIDNNSSRQGSRIAGVKIAGGYRDIRRVSRKYRADEIIIVSASAPDVQIRAIAQECSKTRCRVRILPEMIDLIDEKSTGNRLRDIDIEDLLGREPVRVNLRAISGYLEGRIVMVTGGGGSVGSELCRQICRFKPRRLVAVDIYENNIFELANEIRETFPGVEFDIVIGSVRDFARMEEVFGKYKPHVIFHAAAHKHVPLMEENPREAIANNVLGTKNLLDLAEMYAASKFVLISTDKAVNPISVMGATKRAAELLMQGKSINARTHYAAVRFGNVLGSNGSVIPTFRRQIACGGPVTVTHPEASRYFMTVTEAVQLVIQAGAMAEGGEIFILDMGESVKIIDLAEKLIRLSGCEPYEDIDIRITGLRCGEKLCEELLLDEEAVKTTTHDKIFVVHPVELPPALQTLLQEEAGVQDSIKSLLQRSDEEARQWLQTLVPNYRVQERD